MQGRQPTILYNDPLIEQLISWLISWEFSHNIRPFQNQSAFTLLEVRFSIEYYAL